ncbi:MAG: NUDIX domain-containing protein [Candidatus Pacebacteria bacterium]|jgi:8-oxo-dGTP diphosphatase|nr:NUDIX domain-containing protein [Candidatus Paceibacterota bacterium]
MDSQNQSKVGIGILIFKEGKVLLGKRLGNHAAGLYSGPGGHLEYMESFADCAQRETREETGIEIGNIKFLCLSNLKAYAPHHYVNIGLTADWKSGEPKNIEPDKCAGWNWYGLDEWPPPLFEVYNNYRIALRTGQNYFDA